MAKRIRNNILKFNTSIITYPSDYDGLLSIGLIVDKFKSIIKDSTKLVIAREDPDEEIRRIHYHIYWDDESVRKQVTTGYFNIPLPEPVVVFIKKDKTRTYRLLADLASELGGDNKDDMVPLLDNYVEEKMEEGTTYDILEHAHPNIQLKKMYGDKYFMLRYVVKQKLLSECINLDLDEELKYLEDNKEQLTEKTKQLEETGLLKQLNIHTIDELILLLKKYKLKIIKKQQQNNKSKGYNRKPGKLQLTVEVEEDVVKFRMWLRELVLEQRMTKREVINEIIDNKDWWTIYSGNYLNYNKLVNDMFRGKPPAKPTKHYDYLFWVPNKLYDYLIWLDKWVENWYTGKPLEHRPKGLVLIGASRTGKTTLISTLGDFSYFKNIWNLDCWEGKTAFTIMDDMDAGDEGKGLSFCWYKPFFGAQDAITVTDKFKPKEDIYNGKPLIWLNNFRIEDSFQSKTAQDYIQKNMVIVNIERSFMEAPTGMDIYQYKQFDPKTTWYYKNVYLQEQQQLIQPPSKPFINTDENENSSENGENNQLIFIDETQKVIEKCKDKEEEEEPLIERKRRLAEIKETNQLLEEGRHSPKRVRE